MINLSVLPVDGEVSLFGKTVNELQTGINVSDNGISGTLNSVSDYTDFSSIPDEQSGHYLALAVDSNPPYDKATVELVGGTKGPVTLDADKNIVLLIKNKDSQSVKVSVTKNSKTVSKTYTLAKLVLA